MSSLAKSLSVRLFVGIACVAVLSALSAMVVPFDGEATVQTGPDLGPATVTAHR